MALQLDSWAVAGAQSSARIARLQLTSASRSGNGVVETGDLLVRELEVPGTSVRVDPGAAVILGQEAAFQGSYYAHNVGEATVPISPTGTGETRSDLLILRVEDPGIDGTPWTHDPSTDPVYYFRVIEGVSSTETEAPSGSTAIPLARIDIPASTATITADMITDVRQLANPKTQRVLRIQRGQGVDDTRWDEADYTVDYERWPQHDWDADVPAWATQVQVLAQWSNVWYPGPPSMTNYDARGWVRVGLIGSEDNVFTTATPYNFNPTVVNNGYRCSIDLAAQVTIPSSMRGETVQLRMYARADDGPQNVLVADGYANFAVDMEFLQRAAPGATL